MKEVFELKADDQNHWSVHKPLRAGVKSHRNVTEEKDLLANYTVALIQKRMISSENVTNIENKSNVWCAIASLNSY